MSPIEEWIAELMIAANTVERTKKYQTNHNKAELQHALDLIDTVIGQMDETVERLEKIYGR